MERRPLVLILHTLAWLFIFIMSIFLFAGVLTPLYSAYGATTNVGIVIVVFYSNLYFVDKWIEKGKIFPYIIWFIVALAVTVIVRAYLNSTFILPHSTPLFAGTVRRLYLFTISTTLIAMLMSLFYGLVINRSRREKTYLAIIAHQNEAHLQFLKAQMNPHFLFNTLNNIYSLILRQSSKAADMVLVLSDLLRYAVYDGKEKQVSIGREIKYILNYISLFNMKSEGPLRIDFNVIGSADLLIEPMILIPLVENCFKHTDFDTNTNAFVKITVDITNPFRLAFTTENSFDPGNAEKDKVGGVGLQNIKQRLEIRYPGRHSFVATGEENVFKTTLTIRTNE